MAVDPPRLSLWQTDVAQKSTSPLFFQLSAFEAETEGADGNALDKPQRCCVC